MSRAFVKEPDGDAVVDDQPELPVSPHPNHVTRRGLEVLEHERNGLLSRLRSLKGRNDKAGAGSPDIASLSTGLEISAVERRLRYVAKRIDSAIVFDPGQADPGMAGFGASVILQDEEGVTHAFRIVGEDEADPANSLISWTSPLARQLKDRESGDEVCWRRPKGDLMLEIISVKYEEN